MLLQSKEQIDLINRVTRKLIETYLEPLFELSEEKNYYTHLGSLVEIVNWSKEFYSRYYRKFDEWESFKTTEHNIFKANTIDDFILAFGKSEFERFCAENHQPGEKSFLILQSLSG